MADLYTKNGRPVQVHADRVYSKRGKYVGHLDDGRLFGSNGRYIATVDGDRLVYRSSDRTHISSPLAPTGNVGGTGAANHARSGLWGDEPDIPD